MKKWSFLKPLILLLLTAAVIAAGARLPAIAGDWMSRDDTVSYADITPVELEFGDRAALSPLKKMYLVGQFDGINVSERDTRMTSAQALEAAETVLAPYIDAGLVNWTGGNVDICQPKLLFDNGTGWYGYFWIISKTGEELQANTLSLILDDETGRLVRISYSEDREEITDAGLDAKLDALVRIYQESLDLGEPEFQKDTTTGYGIRSVMVYWSDGELAQQAEFVAHSAGFYVGL